MDMAAPRSTESTRLGKNMPRKIIPSQSYLERRERLLTAEAEREERVRQSERAEYWSKSNVPKRHNEWLNLNAHRLPSDASEWTQTADRLANEVLEYPSMFCLTGPRGTGKTQLAVYVMHRIVTRGKPAWYRKTTEFFFDLHRCYGKRGQSEEDMIRDYVAPYLLVLDEITVRRETKDEDRALTHMLDKRYDAMKPSLLIGNCKPDALRESVGESIYSRLRETGGIVECNWPSFRGKK